jgi:alkylation response protein AidB-like acyl-CoA dehydrogenase
MEADAMDLVLSEEETMIRDAAADLLAQRSASADVRRALAESGGYDDALWRTMAGELGWCGLAVPEAAGGAGLGATALALLMEQIGRRLVCAPYFGTAVLAAQALAVCGSRAESRLAQIAAGETRATLAFTQTLPACADQARIEAVKTGDGYRLTGTLDLVIDGTVADLLLVPARLADRSLALFEVAANEPTLVRSPLVTLDATRPLARVALNGVEVREEACLAAGETAQRALIQTAWFAALALAAEQLGGAQQCLDLTLEYVTGRVQFGRSIASFQAVKHRCAEMLVAIEAARSAVLGAARAWDEARGAPAAVHYADIAVAKASANDAFRFCAQEAIQLHGGVGFTWEYDPQLYFKRAQASGALFGTTPQLLDWLARHVIDGAIDETIAVPLQEAASP